METEKETIEGLRSRIRELEWKQKGQENREYNKPCGDGSRLKVEDAIDRAIEEMPDGYAIKGLIVANRAEVKDMCLTEYNEAEVMEMFKEEGREEGREEGKEYATVAYIKVIMGKLL